MNRLGFPLIGRVHKYDDIFCIANRDHAAGDWGSAAVLTRR